MKLKFLFFLICFFCFPFFVNAETLNFEYSVLPSSYSSDVFNIKVKQSDYFKNYIKDFPNYVCYYGSRYDEYFCVFGANNDLGSNLLIQSSQSGINTFYNYSISKIESFPRKMLFYTPDGNTYITSEKTGFSDIFSPVNIKILSYDFGTGTHILYDTYFQIVETNVFVPSPITFKTVIDNKEYTCTQGESNILDVKNSCTFKYGLTDSTNYDLAKQIIGQVPSEFEFVYSIFSILISILIFLCVLAPVVIAIKLMKGWF